MNDGRLELILYRALDWIAYHVDDDDLQDVLYNQLGVSNDELEELGLGDLIED